MNRWTFRLVLMLLAVFVLVGCSGGNGSNPLAPAVDGALSDEPAPGITQAQDETSGLSGETRTYLWSYCDVYFNEDTRELEAVTNRSAMFTANVVTFLNQNPSIFAFSIRDFIIETEYKDVDIDVSITHPFAGLPQLDGYDVRCVFIGYGSESFGPDGLNYADFDEDQYMLDDPDDGDGGGPDGYTRWFNPTEFTTPGLFGYTHGYRAIFLDFDGVARLNPYKYYADELGAADDLWTWFDGNPDSHGVFMSGSTNTRNYYIRFPNDIKIRFAYAVLASWAGGAPVHHPANTPEAVGCSVVDHSNLYYVDETTKGGNLILDISLYGWDYQPSTILVESTVLNGPHELSGSEMIPIATGVNWATYHCEIPEETLDGVEDNEFFVVAEYDDFDYSNAFGVSNTADGPLQAHFRYPLTVGDEVPSIITVVTPNGGDEWLVGGSETIEWTSENVTGTVFIDYSKDNFASDINPIATGEVNDGSYQWDGIPDDPSDTVRVRVSSTDDPTVYDMSDADFSIVRPSITVTEPNGGEVWLTGTDEEITWTSEYITTLVNIWYSTDNFVSDIQSIAGSEGNDGSFMWVGIPVIDSDTVKVRISTDGGPLYQDESDYYFKVHDTCPAGPTITTGSLPDAIEGLEYSSQLEATGGTAPLVWSLGSGTGLPAGLMLLPDGLISGTPEPGSEGYYADLEFIVTDSCWTGPQTDTILLDLTVCPPEYIEVTSPNGGEEWWYGADEEITWDSAGVAGTIEIDYSTNDFTDTVEIVSGTANDGSHTWEDIPIDFSDTVLVRISSTDDPGIYDDSDDYFSIVDHGWALTWGGSGTGDNTEALIPDAMGNVYLTGYNENHACLFKIGPYGGTIWEREWGNKFGDTGYGIGMDSSGNVYVGGVFSDPGAVDFDPGLGEDWHTMFGTQDNFVVKYTSSGDYVWGVHWGNADIDYLWDIAVDGSGNVYITGEINGTVDMDPDAVDVHNLTSLGYGDAYLSKLDTSGDFLWAYNWGNTGALFNQTDTGYGVAVNSSGTLVYVTGQYDDGSAADFDPGGGTEWHTSNGNEDSFLSCFNSDGSFNYAYTWGGNDWGDGGYGVFVDGPGNFYVTGRMRGTDIDMDPTGGTDLQTSNTSRADSFVSKFNSSGTYQWSRHWGGGTGFADDAGNDVAADGSGGVYVVGYFYSTVDFDPGVGGDIHTSPGYSIDIYITKFDSFGDHVWAHTPGGPGDGDFDYGACVCVDNAGMSFAGGRFNSTAINFAPNESGCTNNPDVHGTNGNTDAFLVKYMSDGCW